LFRRIVEDYEAKLAPVDTSRAGHRARGKAEWERYGNDEEELGIRVRNLDLPDNTWLDVFLNGGLVGRFVLNGGYGVLRIKSRDGAGVPHVAEGNRIEVSHSGTALLAGTFVPD